MPARASLADWRRGRVALADLRRSAVVEEQPNLWLYRIPAILPSRDTGDLFDRTSDRLLATHLRRTLRQRAGRSVRRLAWLGALTLVAYSGLVEPRLLTVREHRLHLQAPAKLPPLRLALVFVCAVVLIAGICVMSCAGGDR